MPIVPFANKRVRHGIENPGSLAAGSFVEVARILLEKRWHHRATDKRSRKNIGVSRPVALCIALHTLSVRAPTVRRLVNSRQHPDPGKRDRVARRFPGKLKLLFGAERSGISVVADKEIRDEPEHPLLLLFLDLHLCQFLRRESHAHLGYLDRDDQHDQWSDVGFSGFENPGEVLRRKTRRGNCDLKWPWSYIREREQPILVRRHLRP